MSGAWQSKFERYLIVRLSHDIDSWFPELFSIPLLLEVGCYSNMIMIFGREQTIFHWELLYWLRVSLPFYIDIFSLKGENDVFGDNICHESTVGQSAVDVFALTYCDLHWIQRDALIEVLEFYPDFANKFTKNLVLSYNLRDEVRHTSRRSSLIHSLAIIK